MKGVKTYESQRFQDNSSSSRKEMITEEKPLRILIKDEPFTVTMRTPGQEKELVLGLLYNEDILKDPTNLTISIEEEEVMDTALISVDKSNLKEGYMSARNFLSISSCGVCGKTSLPTIEGAVNSKSTLQNQNLLSGLTKMKVQQKVFSKTGGCHAAAILNSDGDIISIAEDIGRHNAVDKAIGSLLISKQLKEAQALLVSGRISYEIVIKCFRGKIPVLAAVSAPSTLAIDYAKELGISLFAFCRENRITKFA